METWGKKSLIEKAKCDRIIIITGIKSLDAVGLKDFAEGKVTSVLSPQGGKQLSASKNHSIMGRDWLGEAGQKDRDSCGGRGGAMGW